MPTAAIDSQPRALLAAEAAALALACACRPSPCCLAAGVAGGCQSPPPPPPGLLDAANAAEAAQREVRRAAAVPFAAEPLCHSDGGSVVDSIRLRLRAEAEEHAGYEAAMLRYTEAALQLRCSLLLR